MANIIRSIGAALGMVKTPRLEGEPKRAWDFSFASIDGGDLQLSQFQGQVLMVVNTASRCGLTPQYDALEAIYRRYRERGFTVLGVPSNDFAGQEPGTESQIKEFCTTRFKVDFPLTGKAKVIGAEAHPFYRWVVTERGDKAAPRWNFHKVLIGRDGGVADIYSSPTKPDAPSIIQAIETALAQPA